MQTLFLKGMSHEKQIQLLILYHHLIFFMTNTAENNKRIAKNTLLLYFRMLLTMAVTLYTSRVILATLGIEDFGIYNAVAGFITMFTSITGAMSTATQIGRAHV